MLIILLLSFAIPIGVGLIQVRIFRLFLKPEETSPKLRRGALLWGALGAIIFAAAFQILVGPAASLIYPDQKVRQFFEGTMLGPVSEEILKGLAPLYAWLVLGFSGRRKLLVIGALSGVGFFITESILAFLAADLPKGWTFELIARVLLLGFNHAFFSGLIGLGVGFASRAKWKVYKLFHLTWGFIFAAGCHFWHNALSFAMQEGLFKAGFDAAITSSLRLTIIYVIMLVIARRRIVRSAEDRRVGQQAE